MSTVGELLRQAVLDLHGHEQTRLDAEVLLAFVLGKPRSYLRAWPEAEPSAAQASRYRALVRQRAAGQPLAYLTGHREFWSLDFEVSPATLIPRPETELLVEQALDLLAADQPLRIADLGTGSGAIAVALARERPQWQLYAVDRSPDCLAIARRNAARHTTGNLALINADWCSAFADASLHALVSNPPYVAERDPHLQQGDVRFEPVSALAAGRAGLDDLAQLIEQAPRVLHAAGMVFLEHGPEQTIALHKLLKKEAFCEIHTEADLAGRERVTHARKMP